MSCDRRCKDPESEWFTHDECEKCPGQDSGFHGEGKNCCRECKDSHLVRSWPHDPEPDVSAMRKDILSLISLSKDLLGFADLTTKAPYHMTNGVMIVKNNNEVIDKFDLTGDL